MAGNATDDATSSARIQAASLDRQTNLSFLLKDFEKVFDIYIYSHGERSEATKMFVTISTAPFLLISLFGFATRVSISKDSIMQTIDQFPSFIFLIFSIFGFVGIVPFHRFVAAHANSYKMIRYMNGYRLFYYQLILKDINTRKWRSAIEKDPRLPVAKLNSVHWTTGFSTIMFVLNTIYICLGIYLWDGKGSTILILVLLIVSIAIHYFLIKGEYSIADVDRLKSKDIPFDAILKSIDTAI